MPIPVSPVNREIRPVLRELVLDRRDQVAGLLVDGTFSIEVVVVFGDGEHAFAWNISSTQHVFQEGNHVIVTLRTTEGDNQERVVVHFVGVKKVPVNFSPKKLQMSLSK